MWRMQDGDRVFTQAERMYDERVARRAAALKRLGSSDDD